MYKKSNTREGISAGKYNKMKNDLDNYILSFIMHRHDNTKYNAEKIFKDSFDYTYDSNGIYPDFLMFPFGGRSFDTSVTSTKAQDIQKAWAGFTFWYGEPYTNLNWAICMDYHLKAGVGDFSNSYAKVSVYIYPIAKGVGDQYQNYKLIEDSNGPKGSCWHDTYLRISAPSASNFQGMLLEKTTTPEGDTNNDATYNNISAYKENIMSVFFLIADDPSDHFVMTLNGSLCLKRG